MGNLYDLKNTPTLSSDLRKLTGSSYGREFRKFPFGFRLRGPILLIVLFSLIGFIFFDSLYYIKPGFVGIKVRNGHYSTDEVMPGTHFRIPFAEKIDIVDVRLRAIMYVKPGGVSSDQELRGVTKAIYKGPIPVADKSGREMEAELVIAYQLKPQMAAEVIAEHGEDWEMALLHPTIVDTVRKFAAGFGAEEFAVMRHSELTQLISEAVYEAIRGIRNDPIQISAIELKDMSLGTQIAEDREGIGEIEPETKEGPPQVAEVSEPEGTKEPSHTEALPETAPAQAPAPPAGGSDREGADLIKVEIYFCKAIQRARDESKSITWDLIGEGNTFSSDVGKVTCFTRIQGVQGQITILHRWFWGDHFQGEVPLKVNAVDWRTYSEKTLLPDKTGIWRVDVVRKDDNTVLATASFTVI